MVLVPEHLGEAVRLSLAKYTARAIIREVDRLKFGFSARLAMVHDCVDVFGDCGRSSKAAARAQSRLRAVTGLKSIAVRKAGRDLVAGFPMLFAAGGDHYLRYGKFGERGVGVMPAIVSAGQGMLEIQGSFFTEHALRRLALRASRPSVQSHLADMETIAMKICRRTDDGTSIPGVCRYVGLDGVEAETRVVGIKVAGQALVLPLDISATGVLRVRTVLRANMRGFPKGLAKRIGDEPIWLGDISVEDLVGEDERMDEAEAPMLGVSSPRPVANDLSSCMSGLVVRNTCAGAYRAAA